MIKIKNRDIKKIEKLYKSIKKQNLKKAYKIIRKINNKSRIKLLKKHKIKEFIRKILTRKNRDGKKANIIIYDELHSYNKNKTYNNIIAVTQEEHNKINNNLYIAEYLQNPFEILTEENIQRLEKHCKKAIHYERGTLKEEHEVTLCLLYRYQDQKEQIEKQNRIIDFMANYIKSFEKNVYRDIEEIKKYFERKVENEL